MRKDFPRGSEWRKWDLHIHTPDSALNNQFTSWDSYLAKLEEDHGIAVIGATDYASISGYKRLRKEQTENGRIQNIFCIIPNIEFRVTPHTSTNKGVNLHIVINPDDPEHIDRIDEALNRLTFGSRGQQYSCNKQGLIRLGRAVGDFDSDEKAFREGANQFKPGIDTIRTWYEKESWLKRNSFIAVANSNKDGASGYNQDSGLRAVRLEFYDISRAIFSANPKDRAFFLGQGPLTEEEIIKEFGGLKPCIHGSDAHDESLLFKPAEDRFCWIKADPTFEGLKQTLYEPKERVHIGASVPDIRDSHRIIKSVRVLGAETWFDSSPVPLNSGQVSIIGGKGSGKTALLDMLAYGASAWDNSAGESFIKKAARELRGAKVVLEWAGGENSEIEIDAKFQSIDQPQVRYLSQKFVESLCSDDIEGHRLVAEIESVVFDYLEETDKQGFSSFDELRAQKIEELKNRELSVQRDIEDINKKIKFNVDLVNSKSKLSDERIELERELKGLLAQKPQFETEAEKKIEDEIRKNRSSQAELNAKITVAKKQKDSITRLKMKVDGFSQQIEELRSTISWEIQENNLDIDTENIVPRLPKKCDEEFDAEEKRVLKRLELLQSDDPAVHPEGQRPLSAMNIELKELEAKLSSDQTKRKKYISFQKRQSNIDKSIKDIDVKLANISRTKHTLLPELVANRKERFRSYFSLISMEQEILYSLYQPLSHYLSTSSTEKKSLSFYIQWHADLKKWAEDGENLIDRTKKGPYRGSGELLEKAEELLNDPLQRGDFEEYYQALQQFLDTFKNDEVGIMDQLRKDVDLEGFLNWLYSLKHLTLSYGIKYNGVELENLSPGTKGIVLLILYLEMDKDDYRPILIDQPEENLDNESVYHILTEYFRTAKIRRQIIVVTHNPNLVVNTDSEQVITASFQRNPKSGPRILYNSGSLENSSPESSGIRETVCEILEGGATAFYKRELRYNSV